MLLRDFLQSVGAPVGDLQTDPDAWRGMTWGLIAAWVKGMLNDGYAFALQEAGEWNSLEMPRRYVEDAKIANERVKLGDEE